MKVFILCALIVVASAQFGRPASRRRNQASFAPQAVQRVSPLRTSVPILSQRSDGPLEDGRYSFEYESADGTRRDQRGDPLNPSGSVGKTGGWSYTADDGTPVSFTFEADERGYRPQSSLLPPLPDFVLAQIRFAEEERARGILHGAYEPEAPSRARTPSRARPAPPQRQSFARTGRRGFSRF